MPAECEKEDRGDALLGSRVGPYRLVARLGAGGMGVVYLAEREDDLRRRVAIKLARGALDAESLARFHAERRALASLSHPHIVTLLDGGATADGVPFLVMEYVEGLPLDEYCRQAQPSLRARLALFLEIASAIEYAHRHLVIHCDLKPANVLVTADGAVKLLDFGVAKLLAPGASPLLTRAGLRPFTPEYASPEQVRGEPVTTATDVYGLGLILYELVAGSPAYRVETQDPAAIVAAVCVLDVERPSRRNPAVDADLDAITLKALRKQPQERYPSAAHMAEDVRRYLDGRPVAARRGTLRYRVGKFVQRNRTAAVAIAAGLLALVVGLGAALWQAHAAHAARQRAERRLEEVRKLTRFLLFEFHDAVQKLPGATPIQKALVERALAHLDGLAAEAAGDRDLQMELVEAYTRFGDVQGNPYQANLGDAEGALSSYARAERIAAGLARGLPGDARVLRGLARVHVHRGDVLFLLRRVEQATAETRKGLALLEQAAARSPGDPETRTEMASALEALGDQLLRGSGDSAAALEAFRGSLRHWEEAVRTDPANWRARRAVAGLNMKIGEVEAATDPRRALERFRAALAQLGSLPPGEQASVPARRLRGSIERRMADCLWNLGDRAASLASYRRAAETFGALAELDPANTRAQYDWAVVLNDAGQAMEAAGDLAGALASYDRVAGILEQLLKSAPENVSWQALHAEILVRAGGLLADAGQPAEARRQTMRGLARARRLLQQDRLPPAELTRLARLLLLCRPAELRDAHAALGPAKRAVELTSGTDAYALDTLAEAQLQTGDREGARRSVERALALLDAGKGDSSSWLRRMLESRLAQLRGR